MKIETPLHEAAYWGHPEIAKMLIANGADVNVADDTEKLHSIVRHWVDQEIAKMLIAIGAYINVTDKYGATPLDRAK